MIAAVCIVVGISRANSSDVTVISMESGDTAIDVESLLEFDGDEHYDVSRKREFTFIITRANIEKLSKYMRCEAENVTIRSAKLQTYAADN